MVDKWGYTEDFLQLKEVIKYNKNKVEKKYKCTPEYLKKTIIGKITNNEINIDDAVKIIGCSKRNIKNWLKKCK